LQFGLKDEVTLLSTPIFVNNVVTTALTNSRPASESMVLQAVNSVIHHQSFSETSRAVFVLSGYILIQTLQYPFFDV